MINKIKKIIILGGGSAGWMTAAALGKVLKNRYCEIQLIESDDIGTVGVGEATIPQIMLYNDLIGLDENEFMRRTQATFKLGIEFVNWSEMGSRYYHAFGEVGKNMEGIQFYHYWLKMRALGKAAPLDEYTLSSLACNEQRFMRSIDAGHSPLSNIAYAFHFDAGLFARYLRELAEGWGVRRTEGQVEQVLQHDNGFVRGLQLTDGTVHDADFFIDCSGFRGVLIEQALKTGYDDWSHWLPCDRAIAVPCASAGEPLPYTHVRLHTAPAGNGAFHCSTASAMAMCFPANLCRRMKPPRFCCKISMVPRWLSRVRSVLSRGNGNSFGKTMYWRLGCPVVLWNHWSRPVCI